MKVINIKADMWRLSPDWAVAGTRGSFGCCVLVFEFSPQWEKLFKRITFFPADKEEGIAVLMSENSVKVPDEVMSCAGTAIFVVDGVGEDGMTLVSSRGELRVVDTAYPGGREPREYTPTEIDQLRAELVSIRSEIKSLRKEVSGNGI